MKRFVLATCFLTLAVFVSAAQAADDPSGTWKWTTSFGGQSRDVTLKLKLEGDKLTGVYSGGQSGTETPIDDASIKDDTISFKVTRERNGQRMTTKYSGKLAGDTITGKSERERDGQAQSSDWVARRQK